MSNKIDAYNTATPVRVAASAVKPASNSDSAGAAAKVSAVSAGDTVQLTDDAHQLQQLEKTVAAIPQVDHSRVQRVRDAISNVSYKIDPQAIAAKLARTEWEFQGLSARS